MDADDAQRRIASQIDRAARRAIATHVIDNSADEAELDRRVGEVWDDLLRLRAEG
jgi:dephospho-CoA kinase